MKIQFGNKGIIGQTRAKEHVERIIDSGRLGHAYLFSGPEGVGKTAFALAFAEAVNGVENLSELGSCKTSKKSSWFTHPDIHYFIPVPSDFDQSELKERFELLAKNPYEVINFTKRPSLHEESTKNKPVFYPVKYFREQVKPLARLTPNEGRIVIILTQVETMHKETANAFLKILEEPNDRVMFILTTEHYNALLPTITSRCHHIPLSPLKEEEIKKGLIEMDGMEEKEAAFIARISGGNYSITRFYNAEQLREDREAVVHFLRMCYSGDAIELNKIIQNWQNSHSIEGLISVTNLIETYLRDLIVFRATQNPQLITNSDQIESIRNFVSALKKAKLEEMILNLDMHRPMLRQYVNPKLIFTVLSFRFGALMRGMEPVISSEENFKHLPAFKA